MELGLKLMRLIRIEHERCGEIDAFTFAFCPDEWTSAVIYSRIDVAQKKYLEAIKKAREEVPPEFKNFHYILQVKDYELYPDKTVKEIEQEHKEKLEKYEEWQKSRNKIKSQFNRFLEDEGFTTLWNATEEDDIFSVYWGHRHGEPIIYEDTKTDTTKAPIDFD